MKIVLLGAGNVAHSIVPQLRQHSHITIAQVYSRTFDNAQKLARLAQEVTMPTNDLKDIILDAQLYLYTLQDDVLESVINAVKTNETALHLHTSGSLGLDVFPHAKKHCAVWYPMQTFSKNKPIDNWQDVPLFIETRDKVDAQKILQWSALFSNKIFCTTQHERNLLHIAAVFANNFSNAMFHVAERLLKDTSIPFHVLFPLLDATIKKIHTLTPAQAQTGPARRHDTQTIERETQLLQTLDPRTAQIYTLLSDYIGENIQ